MKRFIFVSFAFLAVAFYVMSDGADFQPRVATIARASAIETTRSDAATRTAIQTKQVQAASLVASPAIAPTVAWVKPEPTPVAFVKLPVSDTKTDTWPTHSGASALSVTNPITQSLVLASLEQGLAGLSTAPPAQKIKPEPATWTQPPADIRKITATRVNMRDGPGTTYPVLTRLTLGHSVEVLDEPGNGWLRLRTLPEERVGWISSSLVSKPGR